MEELSVKKIGKQSYLLLEDITVNSLGYQIKLLKGFDFDAAVVVTGVAIVKEVVDVNGTGFDLEDIVATIMLPWILVLVL